jgi:hypothetical protein
MPMEGVMVKLKTAGKLVMITLINVSDAFRLCNFNGMTLGTTDSIRVKQKSPHSIQANIVMSPRREYSIEPHLNVAAGSPVTLT